jgi:ABC-2 type transport system permease protein
LAPVWEIVLQMMFYATPIIYLLSDPRLSIQIAQILLLNPLAQIMQDFREILINPQTRTAHEILNPWWSYVWPVGIIVGLAVLSVLYFRRQSKMFAEDL